MFENRIRGYVMHKCKKMYIISAFLLLWMLFFFSSIDWNLIMCFEEEENTVHSSYDLIFYLASYTQIIQGICNCTHATKGVTQARFLQRLAFAIIHFFLSSLYSFNFHFKIINFFLSRPTDRRVWLTIQVPAHFKTQ